MTSESQLLKYEYLPRPGCHLSDVQLGHLVDELREVASLCFDELPYYQALTGRRQDLMNSVLTVARRADGTMAGFCAALILDVDGVGQVIHLGLTCVRPGQRGGGLTHQLMSRLLTQYLLRNRLWGRLWISNVACVLSSLGNVARHFENVFPSPEGPRRPWPQHMRIAEAIDRYYRDVIYIRPDARFDDRNFVFRGSVKDTMFVKRGDDARYFHRDEALNRFYAERMDFSEGDEVLQVGYVSLLTAFKYKFKRRKRTGATLSPALGTSANAARVANT